MNNHSLESCAAVHDFLLFITDSEWS